jgi:hypothetical protein
VKGLADMHLPTKALVSTIAATSLLCIFLASAAAAAAPVSAPFTWENQKWCPTYWGGDGCDAVQTTGYSSAAFSPSQVSESSNQISLTMNSTETQTGAFNSAPYEVFDAPATFSESINLPCNSSKQIENWPQVWLTTTGSWPAGGEIDVVEGLSGVPYWHYHYDNASGVSSQVGGKLSGFNGCGSHSYTVHWTSSSITFYYDGKQAGEVTPAEIGVPIAPGPMQLINDYAASSEYGGPITGGVSMKVTSYSYLHW